MNIIYYKGTIFAISRIFIWHCMLSVKIKVLQKQNQQSFYHCFYLTQLLVMTFKHVSLFSINPCVTLFFSYTFQQYVCTAWYRIITEDHLFVLLFSLPLFPCNNLIDILLVEIYSDYCFSIMVREKSLFDTIRVIIPPVNQYQLVFN